MSKVRNIVFDVNETILDLTTITPVFQRLFGSPGAMRQLFREPITYSQALTIADVYVPFADIGCAVLEKIAAPRGIEITATDRQGLSDRFAAIAAISRCSWRHAAVEGGRLPSFHSDEQHNRRLRPPADPGRPGRSVGSPIQRRRRGETLQACARDQCRGHPSAGGVPLRNVHGRLPYVGHHRSTGGWMGSRVN
jgi:hypothetical protein